VPPGIPAGTTPSIAPYFGNNPAFKIFTFSQDTFKSTDYSIMNYDLATNPEQFNSYYTFSTAYFMYGFLNDSLLQLIRSSLRKMQNSSFTESTIFPT